ncbi:hypothetical protein FACS1894159_01180 [Bacteroidia bacterium]|nr:hypothetical protein FACS1894159_01180 [Bacteroidia bacterium]
MPVEPAIRARPEPDSLRSQERTYRLYDTIAARSRDNRIVKLLYDNFFRHADSTINLGRVVDEGAVYERFKGKQIASVTIIREGLFADPRTQMARWVGRKHGVTRRWVVHNYLLFKIGDQIDPAVMVKSKQLLKATNIIYKTSIDITPTEADTMMVDVTVTTHDMFSIGLNLDLDVGGHSYVEIIKERFLRTDHRLTVGVSFANNPWQYGGMSAGYRLPNMLGSFFDGEVYAQKNFDTRTLRAGLSRQIIRPTDYAGGLSWVDQQTKWSLICQDSSMVVGFKTLDGWIGGSYYLPGLKSSLFATVHSYRTDWYRRLRVEAGVNPGFADATRTLIGTGLYREKFYTTTLIYGYGNYEYITSGYKSELVGGYSREEFGGHYYMGLDLSGASFRRNGSYIAGMVSLGTFRADDKSRRQWNRSSVELKLNYFTPLIHVGRNHLRNLTQVDYTRGWNRMTGCDEMVRFTATDGLRGFNRYVVGRNRLVINNETVVFTRWAPYGFRIAMFGYEDLGLIGDRADIFANQFFGTVGLGVRIHNDRLIFPSVQVRLGAFFGKPGWITGDWVSLGTQQSLHGYRFIPTPADVVPYK